MSRAKGCSIRHSKGSMWQSSVRGKTTNLVDIKALHENTLLMEKIARGPRDRRRERPHANPAENAQENVPEYVPESAQETSESEESVIFRTYAHDDWKRLSSGTLEKNGLFAFDPNESFSPFSSIEEDNNVAGSASYDGEYELSTESDYSPF